LSFVYIGRKKLTRSSAQFCEWDIIKEAKPFNTLGKFGQRIAGYLLELNITQFGLVDAVEVSGKNASGNYTWQEIKGSDVQSAKVENVNQSHKLSFWKRNAEGRYQLRILSFAGRDQEQL